MYGRIKAALDCVLVERRGRLIFKGRFQCFFVEGSFGVYNSKLTISGLPSRFVLLRSAVTAGVRVRLFPCFFEGVLCHLCGWIRSLVANGVAGRRWVSLAIVGGVVIYSCFARIFCCR